MAQIPLDASKNNTIECFSAKRTIKVSLSRNKDKAEYLIYLQIGKSHAPNTVSYTHLDVYKRQPMIRTWILVPRTVSERRAIAVFVPSSNSPALISLQCLQKRLHFVPRPASPNLTFQVEALFVHHVPRPRFLRKRVAFICPRTSPLLPLPFLI